MKKLISLVVFALTSSLSYGEVVLPKIMSDGMVLQRGAKAPIWGWANAGETVTVQFAGQTKTALPDENGKWIVRLNPMPTSAEPRRMSVRGKNQIVLNDILVGEVWLASGQSNMEWTFNQCVVPEQEFAATHINNDLIRVFHVDQHIISGVPLDDTIGRWRKCADFLSPPMHSVSAVGFFFALKLQKELGGPVAILDANWGGQPIEMFIPEEGYIAKDIKLVKYGSVTKPQDVANRLKNISQSMDKAIAAAEAGRKIPFLFNDRVHGWSQNGIYNAMIAPLTPYAITGSIWYQGESNRHAGDYFQKLQALSAGWSEVFKIKNIPLYQVQIAPFDYTQGANPQDATLCNNIWSAQYRGAKEIPGMEIVAVHDTNINIKDIHPMHKRPVGERLAAQALQNQYGKTLIATGPSFENAVRRGGDVIVSFSDVDRGLSTKDGLAPSWFELSSNGIHFVPAEAVLNGNTVVVKAAELPSPTHVRMGWTETAIPNLQDKNGWPVFSFDKQPISGN